MNDDPELRCSDAERDATAARLHAHATAGRLTAAELENRLRLTRTAVTRGELAGLLADLPDFAYRPVPHLQQRVSEAERDEMMGQLAYDYAAGRITRAEFDERIEIAGISRTYDEALSTRSDLSRTPGADSAAARAIAEIRRGAVVPAPDWPPKSLMARVPEQVPTRKSSVPPGVIFWGGFVGPVSSIILAVIWNHAASSVWKPGTGSPYVMAGWLTALLGAPVLLMLLLPFFLLEDRRAARAEEIRAREKDKKALSGDGRIPWSRR